MIALEFSTFLGRFHPLVVHLPIGFLLLAILLEWFESFRKTGTKSYLIPIAWLLGGISAAVAAFSGWWLGETGLYKEDNLFVHRWLGIAVVVVAFVGWWLKRNREIYSKLIQNSVNILLLGMLFIEGHKGGNLTHGDEYLTEYAPEPIKSILGVSKDVDSLPSLGTPDSVVVYRDLIHPILESKCIACHNDEVKRGGLNMSHPDSLQLGGDDGPVIAGRNAEDSELFRRITLPQKSIKFMPPTADALTYDEIKTVEWWIQQGASFEDKVTALEIVEEMKPVLLRRYGLDTEPKPWYETVKLAPLDSTQIINLAKSGFTVKPLSAHNPLLDVKYSGNGLTKEQLQELEKVKDYITWLSLAHSNVQDDWLPILSRLSNLTRLQLEKTSISDKGIPALSALEHLEALNLYGTNVTDACLQDIQKMTGLKRVYLWKTKVSSGNVKKLKNNNPGLDIIIGGS